MHTACSLVVALAALAAPGLTQTASQVLVPDDLNDRVMLLDRATGSGLNWDFIPDAGGSPYDFDQPREAQQIGNEIWVVDEGRDRVFRFDLQGQYLSEITSALDDPVAIATLQTRVWILNTGPTGLSLQFFDTLGLAQGSFPVTGVELVDVAVVGTELVLCDRGASQLLRYSFGGAFKGAVSIAGPAPLTAPGQVALAASGDVLVAAGLATSGLHVLDTAFAQKFFEAHPGGPLIGGLEMSPSKWMVSLAAGGAGTPGVVILQPGGFAGKLVIPGGAEPQLLNEFDPGSAGCSPGFSYCTAKVNSLGCTPTIGSAGQPVAGWVSGFTVSCAMVRNQKPGLLFYRPNGSPASAAFQCGTLCVGPSGIRRSPAQGAGGSPPPANDCSGLYSLDMNAFATGQAGGSPDPALLVVGTRVHAQWWGRDQGFAPPCNTTLSDGLQYDICP